MCHLVNLWKASRMQSGLYCVTFISKQKEKSVFILENRKTVSEILGEEGQKNLR